MCCVSCDWLTRVQQLVDSFRNTTKTFQPRPDSSLKSSQIKIESSRRCRSCASHSASAAPSEHRDDPAHSEDGRRSVEGLSCAVHVAHRQDDEIQGDDVTL